MKIAIIGYSGSGKSTLARKLANFYQLPVLHLDSVHFKENWQECSDEDMNQAVLNFLNSNAEAAPSLKNKMQTSADIKEVL